MRGEAPQDRSNERSISSEAARSFPFSGIFGKNGPGLVRLQNSQDDLLKIATEPSRYWPSADSARKTINEMDGLPNRERDYSF